MPISGISSQTNPSTASYENSQQLKTSTGSTYGLQSQNQEKDKSSFFQKWFGSQSGLQNRDNPTNTGKKSGGMSWGEDVHYII
jgi:hypothetical protein